MTYTSKLSVTDSCNLRDASLLSDCRMHKELGLVRPSFLRNSQSSVRGSLAGDSFCISCSNVSYYLHELYAKPLRRPAVSPCAVNNIDDRILVFVGDFCKA